jgi:hypothetical protein
MKRRGFLPVMVALVVMAVSVPARAQAPAQSTKNLEVLALIGAQMGENMKALTGYSFQRRTAVTVNGEQKNVTLVQVAFGPDRQPLITTLSSEPPEQLRGGPFMRRIEENKIAEMKGEIEQVMQLANSYLMLNQEKLGQLGTMAQVWMNPDGSLIRVMASGFQQPGDQVTITCDGQTKRQTETQVTTSIFGGPMTILAHFQKLATGLNYNSQTMIYVPTKGMQIAVNTFNYVKQ